MLVHPDIDPVAISLGPIRIYWYGIMYLLAFSGAWALGRWRARQEWRGWRATEFDDFLFYGVIGVIVGGRLGYVLFYDFARFAADPLSIARVWQGGMSFHGGLIGVLVAMAIFARRRGMGFFAVADFVAPLVPLGLLTGRIGNFINGQLWGRPSELPWAMVFPDTDPSGLPRHPSQLYEAALEGLVMLLILLWFARKPRPRMAVSGLFLLLYGIFRGAVEFVRVPDEHLGYLAFDWLTMGHVLSAPMLVAGSVMLLRGRNAAR